MRFDAVIFDFDGVLLESEYASNRHLAETLTALGHPTSIADSMANFMGLAHADFLDAVSDWIGGPVPDAFHAACERESERAMRDGLAEVAGAAAFVRSLSPSLPRAIASSSSTRWIAAHLGHLGLRDDFGMIFSGREHVARGKPAPDLYLHAAAAMGVDIRRTLIVEDSPIGVTGAVASGAYVVGLCAGRHCATDHDARLRALGVHAVAANFDAVASIMNDAQPISTDIQGHAVA